MSTLASPRGSNNRTQSPSSSRSSLSLDRPAPNTQRRNRAALRDYYGLTSAGPANASAEAISSDPSTAEEARSELDNPDFDAETYVDDILSKRSLEGILKAEAGLVSDIRGLDGERKALVYDNYSKLISATDTIKMMRSNMDPLAPITSTLEPAVAHIASTAEGLSTTLRSRKSSTAANISRDNGYQSDDRAQQYAKRQTVKWVLETPQRLEALVQNDRRDEAEEEWADVSQLLDRWQGVNGVDEIRTQSRAVLNR